VRVSLKAAGLLSALFAILSIGSVARAQTPEQVRLGMIRSCMQVIVPDNQRCTCRVDCALGTMTSEEVLGLYNGQYVGNAQEKERVCAMRCDVPLR
jgi:hypothetical protein